MCGNLSYAHSRATFSYMVSRASYSTPPGNVLARRRQSATSALYCTVLHASCVSGRPCAQNGPTSIRTESSGALEGVLIGHRPAHTCTYTCVHTTSSSFKASSAVAEDAVEGTKSSTGTTASWVAKPYASNAFKHWESCIFFASGSGPTPGIRPCIEVCGLAHLSRVACPPPLRLLAAFLCRILRLDLPAPPHLRTPGRGGLQKICTF